MAIVRKYRKGDIESIELSDIGRKDWEEDSDTTELENGEAYTIEVGKYKCVVGVEPQDDDTYYFWFSADKRINPLYLKYVRAILDEVAKRGVVFTLSLGGKMQNKMHRFFGAKQSGKFNGRILWVRL